MSSEPYGFQRSSSTESRGSTTQNNFGLNFELPRINIQNITQSFTNRSFTPPNFGNFMNFRQAPQPRSSSASARDRPTDAASCDLCGSKFNLLKRRVRSCMDDVMYINCSSYNLENMFRVLCRLLQRLLHKRQSNIRCASARTMS